MSPVMIAVAAFVGVAAMVGGLAMALRQKPGSKVEDRLDILTGTGSATPAASEASVLSQPLDAGGGWLRASSNGSATSAGCSNRRTRR